MTRIAISGVRGLLGWHTAARLHARNCAARYKGDPEPFSLVLLDRHDFASAEILGERLRGADLVLHFAGINRGTDAEVEQGNPQIAQLIVAACSRAGITPHLVYANSTHAASDTVYGNSKRIAGQILGNFAGSNYTDLVLPHIFGECARPFYNNVTATLIDQLWNGIIPQVNPVGRVNLLHAGRAAETAIEAGLRGSGGRIAPDGKSMSVLDLWEKLRGFHDLYTRQIFPDLSDPLDLALFNCLRTGGFPTHYPLSLSVNRDHRGCLFESAKGGNASHTFLSSTLPGKTRGDHFHIDLVERFLVVSGEAVIRVRKVLDGTIHEFPVSGSQPVAIDMPPLHTHHIENRGHSELITFFWSHRMFDPANPDTFADPVKLTP